MSLQLERNVSAYKLLLIEQLGQNTIDIDWFLGLPRPGFQLELVNNSLIFHLATHFCCVLCGAED